MPHMGKQFVCPDGEDCEPDPRAGEQENRSCCCLLHWVNYVGGLALVTMRDS